MNITTKEKRVLISGAVVYKRAKNGRTYWFLVKQGEDPVWEIPKVTVRKGESSVRASMRMMAESGGMNIRVLEEAGKFGGNVTVNGNVLPKTTLYYLAKHLGESEVLAFGENGWFEYANAVKQLEMKSEKDVLKNSVKELKIWRKAKEKAKKQGIEL